MKLGVAALVVALLQVASAMPAAEPGSYPSECDATLCPRLNTFFQCSPIWFRALQACYDPPCNIRYIVDPAEDCPKTT
ncbi:MAG: hypothetical protein M1815_000330 [Lichina confinis]|nr:MAG: hypothetical protein M1815_000330 [Lichina confinis]